MKTRGARSKHRILPVMPSWARFVVAGVIAACFAYAIWLLNRIEQAEVEPSLVLEKQVSVPQLDEALLAQTNDSTRRDRLQIERAPLAHLLAEALDVGPSVAAALEMPSDMVPVATLRAAIDDWRYRWLFYEGELVQLLGPRSGHPIDGYSIYDAAVRLADGESVLATFSIPPTGSKSVAVGDWVRVEGYLLKLRDTTYPQKLDSVPMLIGRSMQRDYEDWPAVTELSPELLSDLQDDTFWPDDLAWRDAEEDQTEALWHLGAFARDTADLRTLADWRKIEPLTVGEPYDRLIAGDIGRGEPMRVFGTLIQRRTIAAPANPANIRFWTSAWVQASGFGGHLIPIWIPDQVRDLPMRAQLEVRGFYYRWYVYDSQEGKRYRVPLFIAADLDTLDMEPRMQAIGFWLGGVGLLMIIVVLWDQRRAAKASLAHSRDLDARRRKRLAANASEANEV